MLSQRSSCGSLAASFISRAPRPAALAASPGANARDILRGRHQPRQAQSKASRGSQNNDLRHYFVVASLRRRSQLNSSTGCFAWLVPPRDGGGPALFDPGDRRRRALLAGGQSADAQLHRFGPDAGHRPADRPGGRAISPAIGRRMAGARDADLGRALPDHRASRRPPGSGRSDQLHVRAGRSLWLADDDPRLAGADSRFGLAARSDPHRSLPPIFAARSPAGPTKVPAPRSNTPASGRSSRRCSSTSCGPASRHRLQPDVCHEGVSARRHAPLLAGLFGGPLPDRQGGKQKFLDFLADGMRDENWSRAVKPATATPTWPCCKKPGSTGSDRAARNMDAPGRRDRRLGLGNDRRSRP